MFRVFIIKRFYSEESYRIYFFFLIGIILILRKTYIYVIFQKDYLNIFVQYFSMPYLLKFKITTESNNSYSNLNRCKISITFATKFSPFQLLNSRGVSLLKDPGGTKAGVLTIFLAVKQKSVWPERGSWPVCFRGTGPSRNSERNEMSLDDEKR